MKEERFVYQFHHYCDLAHTLYSSDFPIGIVSNAFALSKLTLTWFVYLKSSCVRLSSIIDSTSPGSSLIKSCANKIISLFDNRFLKKYMIKCSVYLSINIRQNHVFSQLFHFLNFLPQFMQQKSILVYAMQWLKNGLSRENIGLK